MASRPRSVLCPSLAAVAWVGSLAWFGIATLASWGFTPAGMLLWSLAAAPLARATYRWFDDLGDPLPPPYSPGSAPGLDRTRRRRGEHLRNDPSYRGLPLAGAHRVLAPGGGMVALVHRVRSVSCLPDRMDAHPDRSRASEEGRRGGGGLTGLHPYSLQPGAEVRRPECDPIRSLRSR